MQSTRPADNYFFLQGGGEMGQRIRELDWASTPIGFPGNWPQSLRTAVSILLHSGFPMFIWWGKELIQFYNDAYRPSLGNEGKHPGALGQRGEECWPEIWPVIGPLIRQILDGGPSFRAEDQLIPIYRNNRLEDVYWTFSYSPILDEGGRVGGVLVVCNENTEKVQHFQRLAESEDQLSFAIEAAELGTWDYNPLTGRFKSNNRLKSWFGLQPSNEIELTLAIEAMIEKDRPRVRAAIQQALQYETGGYYDITYTIFNKLNGCERIVRAKGRAWFNDQQIAYRFNGILQDITDPEIARLQLEQAQDKARLAIESADLGTYEIDLRTDEAIISDRFKAIWGVSKEITRQQLLEFIHPDDRPQRTEAHRLSPFTGNIDYDTRILWPDSSQHWIKVKGVLSYDDEGKDPRPSTIQ